MFDIMTLVNIEKEELPILIEIRDDADFRMNFANKDIQERNYWIPLKNITNVYYATKIIYSVKTCPLIIYYSEGKFQYVIEIKYQDEKRAKKNHQKLISAINKFYKYEEEAN